MKRMIATVILLALIILCFAEAEMIREETETLGGNPKELKGNFSGKVTDTSGNTIYGVDVTLTHNGRIIVKNQATTRGVYVIVDVPIGIYTAKYQASGYKDVIISDVRILSFQTTTRNIKMDKITTVKSNKVKTPTVQKVTKSTSPIKTGILVGLVQDESGKSLSYANVLVKQDCSRIAGTQSKEDGNYRIDDLAPGTYDVRFNLVSFPDTTIKGIEISANQTSTLNIILRNDNVAQLPKEIIPQNAVDVPNPTDSESTLESSPIDNKPIISEQKTSDLPSAVAVLGHLPDTGIKASIAPQSGDNLTVLNIPEQGTGMVTGRVTDKQGRGLGNAQVRLWQKGKRVLETTSRPDGTYWLESVPPGVYTIEFYGFGFKTNKKAHLKIKADRERQVKAVLKRLCI